MNHQKKTTASEGNIFILLISKFLPYWPLFAILLIISLIAAKIYLWSATPMYEASASLIIEDENKGVDDSKMTESINPFDSKKIVENEIEVLRSRSLMSLVVHDLLLYAPIYEEHSFGSTLAYNGSPITVEVKNPQKIPLDSPGGETQKVFFTYDAARNKVRINSKSYAIDQWVRVASSLELKFKLNANSTSQSENTFYYMLTNPKIVTNELLDRLEVGATNKLSTVVGIYYKDPIPQRGEDIVNNLLAAYRQKGVTDRTQLAANTLSFIEERMGNVEKELDDLEMEIQQYRSAEGVVDLSEQGRLYLQDVGSYDRQISDYRRQLAVLNSVEKYVVSKNNTEGLVPSMADLNNPILSDLLQKLYNSELEYEKLKKTTGENNPLLVSVKNEIDKIRPSIQENIRSQRNNLNANLGNLNYNSEKFNTALKNLPEKERTLLEISRRQAIKKDLFSFLQKKREETALSYAPNGGDGRVVDMAESSLYPVSPKSLFVYLIALFLAGAVGAGYVLIREMLNTKILFRSEIEAYSNIPIAVELPDLELDANESKSIPSEAVLLGRFRQLSAYLGLYERDFTKKKILVTSSIPGEGKSFVSINLAYSLAQAGKKVVLLDMDFLKPYTTERFQLSNAQGLLDYLNQNANYSEVVNPSPGNKNLSLVPVGTKSPRHTELLLNGALEPFFKELSTNFDYIIMDSAPIDLVSDANLLANFSDKKLFVVRHGYTPKKIIKHLSTSGSKKLFRDMAIVFNRIKKRGVIVGDYGYGYGYDQGREYGYGTESSETARKVKTIKKPSLSNSISALFSENR